MDNLTIEQRSLCMSRIKSENTKPELVFRKYIWANGLRGYRIRRKITGNPDIYYPKKALAVFIDGCFWHKCPECFVRPKTKNAYWDPKLERNVKRDIEVIGSLKKEGVAVVRFWEHQVKNNLDGCYLKLKNLYEKRNAYQIN